MKTSYVMIAFLVMPVVLADHLVINEVLYDPPGADTGQEFVELYNPTEEPLSLEGFSLESGNGANPNDWTVEWTGTSSDSIPSDGFFLIGEDTVLPEPNFITALDLQNGPDAVRLTHNGTVIDLVGYGDLAYPEYYEGTPAPDVSDGSSLSRTGGLDTDSNIDDFTESAPTPQTTSGQDGSVLIQITVEEPLLDQLIIDFPDDDPLTPGIQILPLAGSVRDINVSVWLIDESLSDTSVVTLTLQGIIYEATLQYGNQTEQHFTAVVELPFYEPAGNCTITVQAVSGSKQKTETLVFEYLPLTAFVLDTSVINMSTQPNSITQVIGDTDLSTLNRATLHNAGNVDIDIGAKGSVLSSGQGTLQPDIIELACGTDFSQGLTLSTEISYMPVSLMSDDYSPLSYRVFIPPEAAAGTYTGSLFVSARPVV
jgi:hypothetical protein